jgi:hypothetical protein
MTRHFQRLSMLRIFPKATDHTKKATLNGTLVRQTLSRETETIMQPMTL